MGQVILVVIALVFGPAQDLSERFQKAVELQRQGALEKAADEYRALLTLRPNYLEARANLGVVLAKLGRYDEAIAAYEEALKLAPQFMPLWLNLGIVYHRASQFEKAVPIFERVLSDSPDSLQARQLLGVSLVELGRDAEAMPHLERALGVDPADAAVLYSLGFAYLRLGKLAELRDIINRLSESTAGAAASRLLNGQALLAGFEFERALVELEAAEQLKPDLPRLSYSLGLAYLKLGRNKDAITKFEKELSRTPRDFSTLYYLAYLYEAENQLDAAQARLAVALTLEPQSAEANALVGKILIRQGKRAEALVPLQKAVENAPLDPEKRYQLARLYQQLGRRQEAEREFAEVQRLKSEQLKTDRARTPKP